MRDIGSVSMAAGMCFFGAAMLYEQIFAWHHLRALSVIGAAFLSIGLCMICEKLLKRRS
jgi:hypothetical protein